MSEQKHSPEPWRLIADYPARIRANPEKTRRGPPVAICDNTHGLGDAALTDEANAQRIVACVNALAGIPTEELEAGIVREMKALITEFATEGYHIGLLDKAEQIFARIGRTP